MVRSCSKTGPPTTSNEDRARCPPPLVEKLGRGRSGRTRAGRCSTAPRPASSSVSPATPRHAQTPRSLVPAVPAVIPKPARLEATGGAPFVISESTTVVVNGRPDLIGIAVLAADLLGRVTGRSIEIRYAESDAPDVVRLRLTDAGRRRTTSRTRLVVQRRARRARGEVAGRPGPRDRHAAPAAHGRPGRLAAGAGGDHRGRAAVRVARAVDRRRAALRRQARTSRSSSA